MKVFKIFLRLKWEEIKGYFRSWIFVINLITLIVGIVGWSFVPKHINDFIAVYIAIPGLFIIILVWLCFNYKKAKRIASEE